MRVRQRQHETDFYCGINTSGRRSSLVALPAEEAGRIAARNVIDMSGHDDEALYGGCGCFPPQKPRSTH